MDEQKFIIAEGVNKTSKHWINKEYTWDEIVEKLRAVKEGTKDGQAFVGGALKSNGERKKTTILNRCLITLDIDFPVGDVWAGIDLMFDYECCMYSTFSHSRDLHKYRLVIPLSRVISPSEYIEVSKGIAAELGISMFDISTFQAERLMYYPRTNNLKYFEFYLGEGELLNPNAYITNQKNEIAFTDKQQDPTTKEGIIGAFCRAYTITETIDKFLTDVYEPCDIPNRYTYTKGTSEAGLVIYDDMFACSHHSTDPATGRLCNAFDLIRIHKFPDKTFSYILSSLAKDEKVKHEISKDEFKSIEIKENLIMTCYEYLNSDKGKDKGFLIEGLIPARSIGLISGESKTNKTTIAYGIALAIANGSKFIGHNVNQNGKVLFISIEGSLRGLLIKFGSNSNIDIVESKDFIWEECREYIIKSIQNNHYRLIVLDPLYKITNCNIAKADEVRGFLRELEKLANQYNCTFLVCHHNNRMEQVENSINKVSGSINITRSSEFTIMLKKEKKSDEEEAAELLMSDDELNKKPKEVILEKLDYRYGKEGFRKYRLFIDFYNGIITYEKYMNKDKKASKETRLEDLIGFSIDYIQDKEFIKKQELSQSISRNYTNLSFNTIQKYFQPDIFKFLEEKGYIKKINNIKGFRVIKENGIF